MDRLKVLVIDDSALVRRALSQTIAAGGDMEVITAADPFEAREKILALAPDVLTLDLEMPRVSGLSFLRQLMQHHPLPVVVISSLTGPSCEASFEALRLGAVDVVAKPCGTYSASCVAADLPAKIRRAAQLRGQLRPRQVSSALPPVLSPIRLPSGLPAHDSSRLVAIGASTGGTEAIAALLTALPADIPAMVITQHIPAGFSLAFAQRLDRVCAFEVKEAADGDELFAGRALVAPGNFHLVVRRAGGRLGVRVVEGPEVCYQRPSVDVMFHSVAQAMGRSAVGVLLTGMGTDGAQGLLAMHRRGAATLAQDEETSVIFGMPREALRLGAVAGVTGLPHMAEAMLARVASLPRCAGSS